jgi:predicted small secreted protein
MKKYVTLIVALVLLAAVGAGAALAQEVEPRTLREGRYIVGEDIEVGAYTLTCTATAGEQMKDAYGSLGSAFDALDGDGGYSSLFGALGGMMEGVIDMTVEIVGDYGDVLKRYDMKAGDSLKITLKANTALKITDGSCTLTALR